MKILELCLSPGRGGLELYVVKVCRWAKESGHDVQAITRTGSYLDDWLSQIHVNHNEITIFNRHFPVLAAKKLARMIDEKAIDVIHMHWGKDLALAVLAKQFAHRPVRLVYTRQMALTRRKGDIYHRYLYGSVDYYVVISRRLYEQAVKYLPMPEERIQLLYYGVAAPQVSEKLECDKFLEQFSLSASEFKIGLFGRIERGKGQHILFDAVKELVGAGHNVSSYLIGHIMDQEYFEGLKKDAIDNSIENNFTYIGFHENPSRFMHCFDVVVLASYCETFGLVLIEAMRAGCAVIGTKCGGVPEIIDNGKTGLLFEPGDSNGLKAELEKLINDEEYRKELAITGKSVADERFSEENHFNCLEAIFSGKPN
jgi:glycosyltransferase involved in cell wall biosynthesis